MRQSKYHESRSVAYFISRTLPLGALHLFEVIPHITQNPSARCQPVSSIANNKVFHQLFASFISNPRHFLEMEH